MCDVVLKLLVPEDKLGTHVGNYLATTNVWCSVEALLYLRDNWTHVLVVSGRLLATCWD